MSPMSEARASVNGLRQRSAQKYKSTDQAFDFHQANVLNTTKAGMSGWGNQATLTMCGSLLRKDL
jgi:hypothetical protein